jgi:acetyl esterase/lipase
MIYKKIDLYEHFGITRPEGAKGYLEAYFRDDVSAVDRGFPKRTRPAMLVIGGGGYAYVSCREKMPIAITYMEMGFHAFILDYSVAPVTYPAQLIEACMAMAYIRESQKDFNVDNEHVCAIGFSAGGHLCGMLATMYNNQDVVKVLGEKVELCKPNAVILSYPVISSNEMAHKGSFINISGNNDQLANELSLELKVTKDTPPAFIWSTNSDESVPCENSILMALAYRKAGVPMELHIFEPGGHGLSTCDEEVYTPEPTVRQWIKLSKVWLENRGFIVKNF